MHFYNLIDFEKLIKYSRFFKRLFWINITQNQLNTLLIKKNAIKRSHNLILILTQFISTYMLKKQRLKITQLEKVRFIKVNELKLTQVELF